MSKALEAALLPCKVCNSDDWMTLCPAGNWHVECQDCGYITSQHYQTEAEAVAAWNRRTPAPALPGEAGVRFPHSGMTTAEAVALIDSNTIAGLRIRLEAAEARVKVLEEAVRRIDEMLPSPRLPLTHAIKDITTTALKGDKP